MAVELKDGMRVSFHPLGGLGEASGFRTLRREDGGWRAYCEGESFRRSVFGNDEELLSWLRDGIYRPIKAEEDKPEEPQHDAVEHPKHYTSHPSGIECIQITEHMGFNLGNAVKYIWRADLKHNAIEDLKKAKWYLDRELAKRERGA